MFVKIPDDDTILSQSINRGKKQATRSAYLMLLGCDAQSQLEG
jgi:hypothetical protein